MFHGEVGRAIGRRPGLDQRRDMRMIECGEDASLGVEVIQGFRRQIRSGQHLERDPLHRLGHRTLGQIDHAHAAPTEHVQNAETGNRLGQPQRLPGQQSGRFSPLARRLRKRIGEALGQFRLARRQQGHARLALPRRQQRQLPMQALQALGRVSRRTGPGLVHVRATLQSPLTALAETPHCRVDRGFISAGLVRTNGRGMVTQGNRR